MAQTHLINLDSLIDEILETGDSSFEQLQDIYRFLRKQITKARLIDIADDEALEVAISELSRFILDIQQNKKVAIKDILPSLDLIKTHLEKSNKIDHEDDKIYQDLQRKYNITVD